MLKCWIWTLYAFKNGCDLAFCSLSLVLKTEVLQEFQMEQEFKAWWCYLWWECQHLVAPWLTQSLTTAQDTCLIGCSIYLFIYFSVKQHNYFLRTRFLKKSNKNALGSWRTFRAWFPQSWCECTLEFGMWEEHPYEHFWWRSGWGGAVCAQQTNTLTVCLAQLTH